MREQSGPYHRWSQDHQRLHFGLGDDATVDIRIDWPSGATQFFEDVAAGQLYRSSSIGIEPLLADWWRC